MNTRYIKKIVFIGSIVFITGITGYAFANMGFGGHMGGYANNNYHMDNTFGKYADHMGSRGYGHHMNYGGHMMDSGSMGYGMNGNNHMFDAGNREDYQRMFKDMERFHNGTGQDRYSPQETEK